MYGLLLTMLVYFMINQTIKLYVKKLRLFNTMLFWPLPPVPSKVQIYKETGITNELFHILHGNTFKSKEVVIRKTQVEISGQ